MTGKGARYYINKHLVTLVILPTIVLIHYSWNRMQNNELVHKDGERREFPLYSLFKQVKEKMGFSSLEEIKKD